MPERAEIEAVAREMGGPAAWPMFLRSAEMAIEAVDRVRDARDDDEALDIPAARSPQGEDDLWKWTRGDLIAEVRRLRARPGEDKR